MEIQRWLINPDNPEVYKDLSKEAVLKKIEELNLENILNDLELPLAKVLHQMEERGVALDQKFLKKVGVDLDKKINRLTKEIYEKAGREFNINSPKQLLVVLFDDLKITPRLNSTAADKLLTIKDNHPIIDLILEYREAFKIKNTYVTPLLAIGGEVHTTFVQTGTATGRLSSQNPNLQNIPDSIRSAFISRPDYYLASFDYSQIELRVLASVSGDPNMIDAFKKNLDIHRLTASQVFGVPLDKVTEEMRHLAKTLNFGVIYGMGAAAFAKTSGLKRSQAAEFIKNYFAKFSEIKKWQEKIIKETKDRGYVENLNGRKRWLPIINSTDYFLMAGAERAAINMPIQSLAADIIKMAMLKTSDYRLLLSIHDELVFELPQKSFKKDAEVIKDLMESVYKFEVPLKVNVKYGENWGEMQNLFQ